MPRPDGNLSAEHQRPGDAARPSDTLDRDERGEAGKRATFDHKTGKVMGSGSGAGGNNPGEDYDDDPMAGGGAAAGGPVPASEAKGRPNDANQNDRR